MAGGVQWDQSQEHPFDHNDPGNLERFFGECIVLFGGLAAEEHEMGGEAKEWRMR
jgi:hypothetical protein